MSENTVTMSLAGYNQIKAENTRWQMFMSRMWEGAELREDYSGIDFDVHMIEELVHIMYPDMYKKKLSTLRTQQTKFSMKKLTLSETVDAYKPIQQIVDGKPTGVFIKECQNAKP